MARNDILRKAGSISAAATALLMAAHGNVRAELPTMVTAPAATTRRDNAVETPKLVLTPPTSPAPRATGHSSHSSHASHASHASHQSGSYGGDDYGSSPIYTPPPPPPPPRPEPVRPAPSPRHYRPRGSAVTGTSLTASDLAGKSDQQLALLRNSYYARHGYSFHGDGPNATKNRHYFATMPWYSPDTDDASVAWSRMSAVEQANINLIKKIESSRKSGQ